VDVVIDLLQKVNLRVSLKSLGVRRESIEKLAEDVCLLSWTSFHLNPVEPSQEDIYRLYDRAYEGF
ncbi:MAG: 1,3-propanediol dehydrogenase, partial [Hydrogenobacter thermophilus]|nr:1,3-propanediol dehydrogenase [Hydrogenobacter thermophilus]